MEKELPPTLCETCGAPVRHIPAGESRKTGKPYDEFWACEARCGWTWKPSTTKKTGGTGLIKERDQGELILGEIKEIRKAIDEINEKIDIPIVEE